MEKILFLLAIFFAFLAISSRHKLNKGMGGVEAEDPPADERMAGSAENPQSLTYALSKMTQPTVPVQHSRPTGQPPPPIGGPKKSHEELVQEVDKYIKEIQLANDDSASALEKALNLTREDMALRFTVFQAALSLQNDDAVVRNLAISEVSSVLVSENLSSDNPPPEEVAQRDLQRNLVTTAYKVFIQASTDPDATYNDTDRVLHFQTDSWVRRQIIFEADTRFPQLREKLNEHEQ